MKCYICKHNKKEHTKTITKDGYADSLGCVKCNCETFSKRCNEYFINKEERLDGICEQAKGHIGEHRALLMYVM